MSHTVLSKPKKNKLLIFDNILTEFGLILFLSVNEASINFFNPAPKFPSTIKFFEMHKVENASILFITYNQINSKTNLISI